MENFKIEQNIYRSYKKDVQPETIHFPLCCIGKFRDTLLKPFNSSCIVVDCGNDFLLHSGFVKAIRCVNCVRQFHNIICVCITTLYNNYCYMCMKQPLLFTCICSGTLKEMNIRENVLEVVLNVHSTYLCFAFKFFNLDKMHVLREHVQPTYNYILFMFWKQLLHHLILNP